MKTKTCPVSVLKPSQISRMYEIMAHYYENISRRQFEVDLGQKSEVILLLDEMGLIQGFSTILLQRIKSQTGKDILAIYSGDTVLDREFWGNGALGIAFGSYLLRIRFQNIFTPVYWFLISKGYKTYLLMTNNFFAHYPRYERSTPPEMKALMDRFYVERFGSLYRSELGIIQPQGPACALKVAVADIDTKLLKIPRIQYFVNKNPDWQRGTELACVARVSIWVPVRYFVKKLYRTAQKLIVGLGDHRQKSPQTGSRG